MILIAFGSSLWFSESRYIGSDDFANDFGSQPDFDKCSFGDLVRLRPRRKEAPEIPNFTTKPAHPCEAESCTGSV